MKRARAEISLGSFALGHDESDYFFDLTPGAGMSISKVYEVFDSNV
jgi:hypothetical protein